jgi:hypothetical protein
VEINTMSAISAVDQEVLLMDVDWWSDWVWAHVHASILPWVFDGVEEEDVVSGVVQGAVGKVGYVGGWHAQVWVKDSPAVIKPESLVEGG